MAALAWWMLHSSPHYICLSEQRSWLAVNAVELCMAIQQDMQTQVALATP